MQSTMNFLSGRPDMSRDDCDNLPSEEFPSNVDTLVKLFVFVFHLLPTAVVMYSAHRIVSMRCKRNLLSLQHVDYNPREKY